MVDRLRKSWHDSRAKTELTLTNKSAGRQTPDRTLRFLISLRFFIRRRIFHECHAWAARLGLATDTEGQSQPAAWCAAVVRRHGADRAHSQGVSHLVPSPVGGLRRQRPAGSHLRLKLGRLGCLSRLPTKGERCVDAAPAVRSNACEQGLHMLTAVLCDGCRLERRWRA